VGFKQEPPVTSSAFIAETVNRELAKIREIGLEFVFDVGKDHECRWDGTLMPNGRLVIDVNPLAQSDWSKESFVRLLEYAENQLDCREIYVEFSKNRPDCRNLLHTFMYLGFAVIAPDRAPFPCSFHNIVMAYIV